MGNVGVMGHSLGGAAAYQVCKMDTRCTVAIDMDGTLYGDTSQPSRVPLMYLSSDKTKDEGEVLKEDDYTVNLLNRQQQTTYQVSVTGTAHFNFSDLALYSYKPVMRLLGVVGPIDGQHAITLSNQFLEDMLGKYLKDQLPHYLDSTQPPSDAQIKKNN